MSVRVRDGAAALLATQASTKVYRSTRACRQRLDATIENHGLLAVIPDPVVPFADSEFTQEQRFELAPDASLVAVDWMNAGRWSTGERWAFRRYQSKLTIRQDGKTRLLENLVLDPRHGNIAERMGRFNSMLSLIVIGPDLSAGVVGILKTVEAQPVNRAAALVTSASPVGTDGVILRMAGGSQEMLARALRVQLGFLAERLGDDPWARKW
jgi:urease accessory protein